MLSKPLVLSPTNLNLFAVACYLNLFVTAACTEPPIRSTRERSAVRGRGGERDRERRDMRERRERQIRRQKEERERERARAGERRGKPYEISRRFKQLN